MCGVRVESGGMENLITFLIYTLAGLVVLWGATNTRLGNGNKRSLI